MDERIILALVVGVAGYYIYSRRPVVLVKSPSTKRVSKDALAGITDAGVQGAIGVASSFLNNLEDTILGKIYNTSGVYHPTEQDYSSSTST